MKTKAMTAVVVSAILSSWTAMPAHAVTKVGTLGTLSFTQTGTALTSAARTSLAGWSTALKQAAAVRLEAYGGTASVKRSLAGSRATARAKSVRTWLASHSLGGTITIVNKTWWTGKGVTDKGNRVVIVVTKVAAATTKSLTVQVTSDFDAPQAGDSTVCNFTATSAVAQQGSKTVVSTASSTAVGTCVQSFTLVSVPIGKATDIIVNFDCNVSGDGMPAEDVCAYAETNRPWNAPLPAVVNADTAGSSTLPAVVVTATTAAVGGLRLTVNPL